MDLYKARDAMTNAKQAQKAAFAAYERAKKEFNDYRYRYCVDHKNFDMKRAEFLELIADAELTHYKTLVQEANQATSYYYELTTQARRVA